MGLHIGYKYKCQHYLEDVQCEGGALGGVLVVQDRCRKLGREVLLQQEYLRPTKRHRHVVALFVVDDDAKVSRPRPGRRNSKPETSPRSKPAPVENTLQLMFGNPGDSQHDKSDVGAIPSPQRVVVVPRDRRDQLVPLKLLQLDQRIVACGNGLVVSRLVDPTDNTVPDP